MVYQVIEPVMTIQTEYSVISFSARRLLSERKDDITYNLVGNHLAEEERVGCVILIVYLMPRDYHCSVSLLHGVRLVCECGCVIYWSFSLTF